MWVTSRSQYRQLPHQALPRCLPLLGYGLHLVGQTFDREPEAIHRVDATVDRPKPATAFKVRVVEAVRAPPHKVEWKFRLVGARKNTPISMHIP